MDEFLEWTDKYDTTLTIKFLNGTSFATRHLSELTALEYFTEWFRKKEGICDTFTATCMREDMVAWRFNHLP